MSGTLTNEGAHPDPEPEPSGDGCPHGYRWKAACETCNPAIQRSKLDPDTDQ